MGVRGSSSCVWGCLEPHGAQGQRHQLSNSCSDGCGVQSSMYRLDPGQGQQRKAGYFVQSISQHQAHLYTSALWLSGDILKQLLG